MDKKSFIASKDDPARLPELVELADKLLDNESFQLLRGKLGMGIGNWMETNATMSKSATDADRRAEEFVSHFVVINRMIAQLRSQGNIHRYVYYGCIRKTHPDCKGGLLREEELVNQLIKIVDEISLDQLGIKEKIEQELRRYDKFRYGVLGLAKETNKQSEIDSKNYAQYILKEGTIAEKRELLSCMTSKLIYDNKTIRLEK